MKPNDKLSESRRGGEPADEAYLRLVGERVRLQRMRLSMSRKLLSQASGVSERYLAELERGTGNASLLVLRRIAEALCLKVADFVSESVERPVDLTLAIAQLERLNASEVMAARRYLSERYGPTKIRKPGLVALIGLRGAGKAAVGQAAAEKLGLPIIELDREVERTSGMDLAEIFSVRGEKAYREIERECLEKVIAENDRAIITTGGGIVTDDASFKTLLTTCYTVWLRASPEQLIERARDAVALRPSGLSRQATTELTLILEDRQPLYAQADAGIDTSDKSEAAITSELIDLIDRHFEEERPDSEAAA